MINSIKIQNEASYDKDTPQKLTGLSQCNFIFGGNATGKTTISRIIEDESKYPDCSIDWNGEPLETFVYNRDFVKENFEQTPEFKGIFILGKGDKDTKTKIDEANSTIEGLDAKITINKATLSEKMSEQEKLVITFDDQCWIVKTKHDGKLKEAFSGFHGSTRKFMEQLLIEAKTNDATLLSLSDIEKKAEIVFAEAPKRATNIAIPTYKDLLDLESNPILAKKIVGNADVDIAAMINTLGNSDWVKQGQAFYEVNNKICPFCQQETKDSLAESLKQYFDNTFDTDTKAIEQLYSDYETIRKRILAALEKIQKSSSEFLDTDKFDAAKKLFESESRSNLQQIDAKKSEPSRVITLQSLSERLDEIKDLTEACDEKIKSHNKTIDDLPAEKKTLTSQVWKYLLENEIKDNLASYEQEKEDISKATTALTDSIDANGSEKHATELIRNALERKKTGTKAAIIEINKLLNLFGFNDFKVSPSTKERCYELVRSDGKPAKDTLSEGEINFLTFLYFHCLLEGSVSESGTATNRIVVFDDPVSSLDSDVLFVVSALIRSRIEELKKGEGNIKQIFVLTHNIYFHKQVSYKHEGGKISFWTVRKPDKKSILTNHSENPIKSSYELLWVEVNNHESVTIQNTLRRILESCFKLFGIKNVWDIPDKFEGNEKTICGSLISWAHAGSHRVFDDDMYAPSSTTNIEYLKVFKDIFFKLGHIDHYKMMMGEDEGVTI